MIYSKCIQHIGFMVKCTTDCIITIVVLVLMFTILCTLILIKIVKIKIIIIHKEKFAKFHCKSHAVAKMALPLI